MSSAPECGVYRGDNYLDAGGAHRLTAIEDAAGNRIDYTLDAAGNRTAEATQDANATVTRQLSRTYDLLNRLIEQRDAHNQPTGFAYDANGNQTGITDALDIETQHDHDPLNRLKRTLQDVAASMYRPSSKTTFSTVWRKSAIRRGYYTTLHYWRKLLEFHQVIFSDHWKAILLV